MIVYSRLASNTVQVWLTSSSLFPAPSPYDRSRKHILSGKLRVARRLSWIFATSGIRLFMQPNAGLLVSSLALDLTQLLTQEYHGWKIRTMAIWSSADSPYLTRIVSIVKVVAIMKVNGQSICTRNYNLILSVKSLGCLRPENTSPVSLQMIASFA